MVKLLKPIKIPLDFSHWFVFMLVFVPVYTHNLMWNIVQKACLSPFLYNTMYYFQNEIPYR